MISVTHNRISEQVKTSCQNAITVVKSLHKDGRVIAGGGAAEIQVFLQLKRLAAETGDVTQVILHFQK